MRTNWISLHHIPEGASVNLQKTLAKNPRWESGMELVQLVTGVFLLGFLQFHVMAVSTIILGAAAFNKDAQFLDEHYISYIGIPLVILAIFVHGLAAMRKAPWKFQEARVFLQHSRRLGHLDTWAWLVQIGTGMAVLVLGVIHIWSALLTWPIAAATSAARVQGGYFSFLLALLLVAEIHAMVGLYRILVKWSAYDRHKFVLHLIYATLFFVVLGLLALIVFLFINVKV
ncbi:MAG: succinate dehydrogenase [Deltaproteobacteria bacterium]|nr:succinate dehydrogenase [Deltaproteobacteria bacterium]